MIDCNSYVDIKRSSERSFGAVFSIFTLAASYFAYSKNNGVFPILIVTSVLLIGVTVMSPRLLRYPNLLWFKFGILLGKLFSPIIMTLLFFCVFCPLSFCIRISNKDLLQLRIQKSKTSYWTARGHEIQSMKDQF